MTEGTEPQRASRAEGGLLVVLTGPSGVGKGTVREAVLPRIEDARVSVSVTTRPPRPTEVDGVDYRFVDREEFRRLVDQNRLLEWAEYAGNLYGTPREWVEEAVAAGAVVILEIEVQGALQVREVAPDALLVFLAPPSLEELARRLAGRGTETPGVAAKRLAVAREELAQQERFDVVVVNDDLATCVDEVTTAIRSARSRLG